MERKSGSKDSYIQHACRMCFSGCQRHTVLGAVNEPTVIGRCYMQSYLGKKTRS